MILTPHFLILLIIFITWAKAGLAGDWLLFTIDCITILYLTFYSKKIVADRKIILFLIPVIIICFQFYASCMNPSYKQLENNDLAELDTLNLIKNEQNLSKKILTSEGIESVILTYSRDPSLATSLFFDLKNRYFDKFPNSTSSTAVLLEKYENLISLKPNPLVPCLAIFNYKLIYSFIHFISQILIGVVFYSLLNDRKFIRSVCKILVINAGVLSLLGIYQKINYVPGDDVLEIWGIWDTPEPRYYFASFTYKNHWSAFALLMISLSTGLIINSAQRKGLHNLSSPLNIIMIISLLLLIISIPLSGSRSGSILLVLLSLGIVLIIVLNFKFYKVKHLSLIAMSIITFFAFCYFFTKMIDEKTTDEMNNNFDIQITNLNKGKYPLRILLWKDLLSQISEKPFFGHGFQSYRTINPAFQSMGVRTERNVVLNNAHSKFIPLIHSGHNEILEKISEFGIFGFVLIIPLFCYVSHVFVITHSLFVKILIFGCLVFVLYSFIDFPSQTPICLITFSIVIGLLVKYHAISKT